MDDDQKLSQTSEPTRSDRLSYIGTRWDQLLRLVSESELRALRYLTFTNAGGAVTTLSFLGTSEAVRKLLLPKFALVSFVVGIVLVGILNARSAHHIGGLLREWKSDVQRYSDGEIGWRTLMEADNRRVKRRAWVITSVAYLAFACVVVGAGMGLWGLLFTAP